MLTVTPLVAAEKSAVSTPSPPISVSLPAPPISVSLPAEPSMISKPEKL
jgi:hypothetical protein